MKPMIALIATGIILLLIMLYFGNTSFEGTFETNVYQNSIKYNKTSGYIIELGKKITNVSLKYNDEIDAIVLNYNFNNNDNGTYKSAEIISVELTYPNKEDIIPFIFTKDIGYTLNYSLNSGFYNVIFYVNINQEYTVKVLKTVYFE